MIKRGRYEEKEEGNKAKKEGRILIEDKKTGRERGEVKTHGKVKQKQ
jgi:hypothetical protein